MMVESICESRDKVIVLVRVLNSVLFDVMKNREPRLEEMLVSVYNVVLNVNDMVSSIAGEEYEASEVEATRDLSGPISELICALESVR